MATDSKVSPLVSGTRLGAMKTDGTRVEYLFISHSGNSPVRNLAAWYCLCRVALPNRRFRIEYVLLDVPNLNRYVGKLVWPCFKRLFIRSFDSLKFSGILTKSGFEFLKR